MATDMEGQGSFPIPPDMLKEQKKKETALILGRITERMRVILETMNDSTEDYSRQLNVPMPPEFVLMNDNTVEEVLLPKVIGKLQAWRGGSYKKPVEGQNALKKLIVKIGSLSEREQVRLFLKNISNLLETKIRYAQSMPRPLIPDACFKTSIKWRQICQAIVNAFGRGLVQWGDCKTTVSVKSADGKKKAQYKPDPHRSQKLQSSFLQIIRNIQGDLKDLTRYPDASVSDAIQMFHSETIDCQYASAPLVKWQVNQSANQSKPTGHQSRPPAMHPTPNPAPHPAPITTATRTAPPIVTGSCHNVPVASAHVNVSSIPSARNTSTPHRTAANIGNIRVRETLRESYYPVVVGVTTEPGSHESHPVASSDTATDESGSTFEMVSHGAHTESSSETPQSLCVESHSLAPTQPQPQMVLQPHQRTMHYNTHKSMSNSMPNPVNGGGNMHLSSVPMSGGCSTTQDISNESLDSGVAYLPGSELTSLPYRMSNIVFPVCTNLSNSSPTSMTSAVSPNNVVIDRTANPQLNMNPVFDRNQVFTQQLSELQRAFPAAPVRSPGNTMQTNHVLPRLAGAVTSVHPHDPHHTNHHMNRAEGNNTTNWRMPHGEGSGLSVSFSSPNMCHCCECSNDPRASSMPGAPSANLIATTRAIREFQGPTNSAFRDRSQRVNRQILDHHTAQRKMSRNAILSARSMRNCNQRHHPMSTGPIAW